jgi:hypothetical protein
MQIKAKKKEREIPAAQMIPIPFPRGDHLSTSYMSFTSGAATHGLPLLLSLNFVSLGHNSLSLGFHCMVEAQNGAQSSSFRGLLAGCTFSDTGTEPWAQRPLLDCSCLSRPRRQPPLGGQVVRDKDPCQGISAFLSPCCSYRLLGNPEPLASDLFVPWRQLGFGERPSLSGYKVL